MKVRVGDNVKVLAGKDKGKEGKVVKTYKSQNRVVVEGVNIVKKHSKPRTTEEKGGIVEIEASIHVSNVKVLDGKKAAKTTKTKEVKEEKKETAKKTTKKTTKKDAK